MKSFTLINTILVFSVLCSALCKGQVTVPSNCEKSAVILYSIPECNSKAYELIFEDDFNGGVLDTSKWELACCYYGALLGGQYQNYYTLDNITVSGGICNIFVKKEEVLRRITFWFDSSTILSDGLPNLRKFDYTSGIMWTKKKFFHGKYEARCRMPGGNGLWPAFWLYGGRRGNEIDIFDNYLGKDKLVNNALHDYDGDQKMHGCYENFGGYDFTQWHTFTCIFDFDKISFLVDDHLVRIVNRIVNSSGQPINCGDNIAQGAYFFLKSFPIEQMHLIFNLALTSQNGPPGSLAGNSNTPLSTGFEIDYVKIWKQGEEKETIAVRPNPGINKVTISSNYIIKEVRVFNINGKEVLFFTANNKDLEFDIANLTPGIYIASAIFENSFKSCKIIKMPN